ncbi:MAG: hypothetical protein LBH47_03160 [Christensenellaceae bacterium]|jgi:hypothetical protein|nr:hypothetical protein [Christensenellaceae bacterium]
MESKKTLTEEEIKHILESIEKTANQKPPSRPPHEALDEWWGQHDKMKILWDEYCKKFAFEGDISQEEQEAIDHLLSSTKAALESGAKTMLKSGDATQEEVYHLLSHLLKVDMDDILKNPKGQPKGITPEQFRYDCSGEQADEEIKKRTRLKESFGSKKDEEMKRKTRLKKSFISKNDENTAENENASGKLNPEIPPQTERESSR